MQLYGKQYTKEEIRSLVGNESQIFGIKSYTLNEGKEKGVSAFDVKTGSGLNFTVLLDRALDIAWMEYMGRAVSYITKSGITNPQYYQTSGYEWLRSFGGGILTTCGLTNVGDPEYEGIWELGLHGRISNTPAFEVSQSTVWDDNGDVALNISGKLRESVLYEENLELTRKITSKAGESKLIIHDTIENIGFCESPFMLLYHINLGFPLLSEDSRLFIPIKNVVPREDTCPSEVENIHIINKPDQAYETQVFFIEPCFDGEGNTLVGIVNDTLKFGFYIKYNVKELPYFTVWKMLGKQDYVVGIEPGNCTPIGRKSAKEKGMLEILKPGQKKSMTVEMCILEGNEQINRFRESIDKLKQKNKDF